MTLSQMKHLARFINDCGEKWASFCLAIFSLAALLLMVTLVGVGVLKMGMSLPQFLGFHLNLQDTKSSLIPPLPPITTADEAAVGTALEGLECIFLAPLAFLLVRGIWDFVDSVIRSRSKEVPLSSASPAFMVRIKALIMGLMVAVVATDLLKRALSKSGLTYEPAIAGCLFISVLVAYALLMQRSSSHDQTDRPASGHQ